MEQWESLLDGSPTVPDIRFFCKAVQTASVVLKEDLAPFEIEWILQTLLHKPVDVLSSVASKRRDDAWAKTIADAFKLLAQVAESHAALMEQHFDDVVNLCFLQYDAQTRKHALACLNAIAKVSVTGARDLATHINALENVSTTKAPLAILIGTICEHHPQMVESEVNKIWRIYLILLDSHKNTDTIKCAILKGILGLFKHFGSDLPTAEVNAFYDKLVDDYIRIASCGDVCFEILSNHAHLFPERLTADVRVRNYLWNTLNNATGYSAICVQATQNVYRAICSRGDKQQLAQLAARELVPHVGSSRTQVKYTALRVLTRMRSERGVEVEVDGHTDVQALEFELRNQNVSYDVAEAISWYIESSFQNSDTLLQTAILFYENLPANRRKAIVVHGILNASEELRSAAISFLISESTRDSTCLERHQTLWKDLFDTNNGADSTVADKARHAFGDFMGCLLFALEGFLDERVENLTEKLSNLLQLTSLVLTSQPYEDFTCDYCLALLPLLTQLIQIHPDSVVIAAARNASLHIRQPENAERCDDVILDFLNTICLDRCKDEAMLCESCLAVVLLPFGGIDTSIMALQIIFSRNDVEPSTLSTALRKLETLMKIRNGYNEKDVDAHLLQQVERLHNRKDLSGKEAKILHKDVMMFLGKYGKACEINNNYTEDIMVVKLMDSLTLNLPNVDTGTTYKLNLQGVVQLALEHEEPKSLQMLLVIICANLSSKQDPNQELVLSKVVHALSAAHARGHSVDTRVLQAATTMCRSVATVLAIVQYISEEKSPGVRKMLSDALEALLVKDHEDKLISAVAEHVTVLMNSTQSTTIRAGITIAETLITSLRENNALLIKLLPGLLVAIVKTTEMDSDVSLSTGVKIFLEKIDLFDTGDIDKLIKDLLKVLLSTKKPYVDKEDDGCGFLPSETNALLRILKSNIKTVLNFIKDCKREKAEATELIFGACTEFCVESLYVTAMAREVFDLETDVCRDVWTEKHDFVDTFFRSDIPHFMAEAAMNFFERFHDVLLELHHQRSLHKLGSLISKLNPYCIKFLHKNLKACLSVYTKDNTPSSLQSAFEDWCSKVPIKEITESIEKECFKTEHSIVVFALKVMLDIFGTGPLVDMSNCAQKWAKILLALSSKDYITKYLKSKISYLTDILIVSLKFSKTADIKKLLLEGSNLDGLPNADVGVRFCRFFIHVFYDALIKKPHFLLDDDMAKCCILLYDVVKFTVKKNFTDEQVQTALELVERLWHKYEVNSSFIQKHLILLDLNNLPRKLSPESKPMQWAINNVMYSEASREEKARLIGVLPGGEACSQAYRTFASTLPTRLSEVKGGFSTSLRAILDALASTKDRALLDIIMTLASGDETRGWWDDAIDSCMASIAAHENLDLCKAVYARCWDGLSMGICRRVLLPLLRYSTSSFNEQFFSTILNSILTLKEQKVVTLSFGYHQHIVNYTRTLLILQVAFEKVSPTSLESPSSVLYKEVKGPITLWHIIRTTCALCFSLRKVKLPERADDKFKEDFRQFQCANYNCFAAAICRRRPDEQTYNHIFDPSVWDTLVDPAREYKLYIRHQWNQRTRRTPVSIAVEGSHAGAGGAGGRTVTSLPRTATLRSRMFLRTLSENPFMFDLLDDHAQEEQVVGQELLLSSNELNGHECAGALTALLCHVSALPHTRWRAALSDTLARARTPTRWLLAQVICNCIEDLKPHASALRAALLTVVATTPIERDNKKLLNGLHVQILETLVSWGDESPSNSPHLDTSIQLLIITILEYRTQTTLFRSLLDLLTKLLELYSTVISIPWEVFEANLADSEAWKVMHLIAKCKVHMPSLLPTLLTKLETKQSCQLPHQLIGSALSACSNTRERHQYLTRLRKALDQQRKTNAGEYIKMLFYAQTACAETCDEYHFRMIVDLTSKFEGPLKSKCLQIISTYIAASHSSYIQDMFETIDLAELISLENVEAFGVVSQGVNVMPAGVKRRLLMIVAKYATHSVVKVRKAASEVMLRAVEELFTQSEEPSAKRAKITTTEIISKILVKDMHYTTLLGSLAAGAIDKDGDISKMVTEGVGNMLQKDMGIRMAECFFIFIFLPAMTSTNAQNLSVCVSAFLEVLLADLRAQDRFKRVKLRDEPLELRSSSAAPSKLLTMSRTYQGSFKRRSNFTSTRKIAQTMDVDLNTPEIDVQISIESILDTFMQFCKVTPEVAQELSLLLIQAIKPQSDLGPEIAKGLAAILEKGLNDLTPFVLDLCRIFIEDLCKVDRIKNVSEKVYLITKNTEGEHLAKWLYQEVKLRCEGHEQFVLGSLEAATKEEPMDEDDDEDESATFSMQDLTSVFGKLSNWDNLTMQQRDRTLKSKLPSLWTDHENFKEFLDNYIPLPTGGWFSKMASAYKQQDRESVMKWMRELDKWPRRRFQLSAITEAIEWQNRSEERAAFPSDIRPADCLAEWAARFMIRAAFETSVLEIPSEHNRALRDQELQWCEVANQKGLASMVLECVRRNSPNISYQNETLPWLCQKVDAFRNIAIQRDCDGEMLRKAHTTLANNTSRLIDDGVSDGVIEATSLLLRLHLDLNDLTKTNIDTTFELLQRVKCDLGKENEKNKQRLKSIYEIAAMFFDAQWDGQELPETEEKQNCLLLDSLDTFSLCTNNVTYNEGILAMILNRLDDFSGEKLRKDVANRLLDQIKINISSVDDYFLEQLKSKTNLFPPESLLAQSYLSASEDANLAKYKKCFQLICDAQHSLYDYCKVLWKALKDGDYYQWEQIFATIKEKLFENPYSGSDYQLLNRYKKQLYSICDYDMTPVFKANATKVLEELLRLLSQRSPPSSLRLSQLCPTLSACGDCPGALLGLPTTVSVVRFDEQVSVLSSLRRPALFRVLLSDGRWRRYLHKSGESLRADAAAQRASRSLPLRLPTYLVTPLSEDSGLIEFLEDHVTLRSLMNGSQALDTALDTMPRPADHELILAPMAATLSQHQQRCDQVPSSLLRHAVMKRAATHQDLANKINQYTDSLSSTTIFTWLLGVGDRHLENILYSVKEGRVCHIDWNAVLQYGCGELPAARLTRNLLAVCDAAELEARLQQLLTVLRESHRLYASLIKISFKRVEGFDRQFPNLRSLLRGSAVSYHVTREALENSSMEEQRKQKYTELLDTVFEDLEYKNEYTVDEQVSCLLRHCTDPRILGTTRHLWEPWV